MSREVWGTCAVNDHMQMDLLLRALLVFDRLVVPYPSDDRERERWSHPNSAKPDETWNPDGLDRLLSVLGTQDEPGLNGAHLTWTSPWNLERWQTSRREMADIITTYDAFWSTRQILAMGRDLPGVIEAVAVYPSENTWRAENHPSSVLPADPTAATALVTLARPLLLPDSEGLGEQRLLQEVVDLAADPDFRGARTAYHDWLRDFVAPLQANDPTLAVTTLDDASLLLAKEKLDQLVANEQAVVQRSHRRRRWRIHEAVMMVVGTAAAVGLAVAFPPAPVAIGLGVLAPTASFAGWIAGKRGETPQQQPLNGASMFIMANRALAT